MLTPKYISREGMIKQIHNANCTLQVYHYCHWIRPIVRDLSAHLQDRQMLDNNGYNKIRQVFLFTR